MSYVPVNMWVPDTQEGSVVEAVNLKPCDTCKALVPMELMDAHVAQAHPDLSVTPH
jgi:hypothetical protein